MGWFLQERMVAHMGGSHGKGMSHARKMKSTLENKWLIMEILESQEKHFQ
jgi:hypothetical protein